MSTIKTAYFLPLLIAVSLASVGYGAWQYVERRKVQEQQVEHAAKSACRAAYFLYTTASSIETITKENKWEDEATRNSFRTWTAYGLEGFTNLISTLEDFPSVGTMQDRRNMSDLSLWYSQWFSDALSHPAPLTDEDKRLLTKLSDSVSKVEGFYVAYKFNDWNGIAASIEELHKVWGKERGL